MRFHLYSYALEFYDGKIKAGLLVSTSDLYAGMTRENIDRAMSVVYESRKIEKKYVKRAVVQMVEPSNVHQLVEDYLNARRDAGLGNEWALPYLDADS